MDKLHFLPLLSIPGPDIDESGAGDISLCVAPYLLLSLSLEEYVIRPSGLCTV